MRRSTVLRTVIAFGIPVLYAIVLRFVFGIESWNKLFAVMSLSFLCCLPTIMGALTVYLSPEEKMRKWGYQFFAPWVPVMIFFAITMLLSWEGWACWLMMLPFFLLAASLGGFIGGYLKLRKKKGNTYISAFMLLPLLIAPLESMIGSIPGTYEASTSIDIDAPAEKIWNNVTNVREISAEQDKGWLTSFLGFPRPVRAELNYRGVGASREAIFTKGLVFHETVSEYAPLRRMVFSIKAYPYEIPSATMDKHVVIGGQYFDVLNGTYELEKLNGTTYRLHLYSHFRVTTTFNFYAGFWARLIMKDIQNNILQIEKHRAEKE